MASPGKAHRAGISLTELFEMFPDEDSARKWFEGNRWPDGAQCVHCDSKNVYAVASGKPLPWRCIDCRGYFSVRMNTVMAQSKIPLRKWAIAVYLFATSLKGVSSMKLHRDLKITQKSAWFLAHRIREAMADDDKLLMGGPVEADETYVGGRAKNKHASQKKGKLTGGTADKAPIIGIKDRTTGRVVAKAGDVSLDATSGFIYDHVKVGAKAFTDDSKFYNDLKWIGYDHKRVVHTTGEYVKGEAHTQGIESFWSMLKRAYVGVFHYMSPKHLQRYADEFAARASMRDMDTEAIMTELHLGGVGKRLTYARLIA